MVDLLSPATPEVVRHVNGTPVHDAGIFYLETGKESLVFEQAWRTRLPLMIKGPTGCGKTRFVEYMAARLARPMVTVSCNEDTSPPTCSAVTSSKAATRAGWMAR